MLFERGSSAREGTEGGEMHISRSFLCFVSLDEGSAETMRAAPFTFASSLNWDWIFSFVLIL